MNQIKNETVEEDIVNERENLHVANHAKAGTESTEQGKVPDKLTQHTVSDLIKLDYNGMNYKAKYLRLNLYQQKWISTEQLCRHPISLGHNVFHQAKK